MFVCSLVRSLRSLRFLKKYKSRFFDEIWHGCSTSGSYVTANFREVNVQGHLFRGRPTRHAMTVRRHWPSSKHPSIGPKKVNVSCRRVNSVDAFRFESSPTWRLAGGGCALWVPFLVINVNCQSLLHCVYAYQSEMIVATLSRRGTDKPPPYDNVPPRATKPCSK